LTYSQSQTINIGALPQIANHESRIFKVRWEYERMREWCYVGAVSRFPLDVWKWVPTRLTGGNAKPPTTASFPCDKYDTFSAPTWVTKTGTEVYQAFFSIAGIGLDSAQTNSEKHKFTIIPDNDVDRTRYCGNYDYPLSAIIAKEVPPQ
jgi:hypothetical protein